MAIIGLLGGSFNPAHIGHIQISSYAKKQLKLDELWWIITPHNPNKNKSDLRPLEERMQYAKQIDKPDYIRVKTLEEDGENNYSSLLIKKLRKEYKHDKLIWLMGADNLESFHLWYNWQDIIKMINIAVFPRNNALEHPNILQKEYSQYFISPDKASLLRYKNPPYWTILKMKKINISATEIRENANNIK